MGAGDDIFKNLMAFNRNTSNEEFKKLKPSERLLKEIASYGFNMSQLETILKTSGNQLIVSGAGSGKTTALIFKIIFDLKSGRSTVVKEVNGNKIRVPDTIWVSTFLKSGAEELEASLRKWQRRLHCVDTSTAIRFSTLHAEFKRALMLLGIPTDIISATDNSNLLKKVTKQYQLYNADGRPLNSENYRALEGVLTYTRNRLDKKRYTSEVYDELKLTPTIIDSILRDWKAERLKKGVCDFEDLQERLYLECYTLGNQKVIKFLSERYRYIYLDEFQDTSQMQYAILKLYGSEAKQVIAIGDDDQTIYSWRGSYNGIITKEFLDDFMPVRNDLSINFRCPSNILNAIKPSIECNKNRFSKELSSSREGGVVRYGAYGNYKSMVEQLSDLVYEDIKKDKSVAILCRVNSDGLMPAIILDKLNKFSFSISGDGMTLDSYIGRLVLSIIRLFTERSTPAVKNALGFLTWDNYCVDNLMRVCRTNKLSIWTVDKKDLAYSCPEIAPRILKWREWYTSMGEVEALKLVLQDYRTEVFVKSTQFNDVVRSVISSIEALLNYFDYKYAEDFLIELEDINERLKARKKKKSSQIKIATVHEFKGKESDSVYVWNDSEDVFPHRNAGDSFEAIEEERRVHYIACTRAKETSTLMYIKSKPGRFISEMDLSDAECIGNTSGITGKIVKTKLEEDSALEKFEAFAGIDDPNELNEFWDKDNFEGVDIE